MKNYIKLKSILSSIPKSLFQEANESDFIDTLLDGIKLLPDVVYYEPKIELFEIVDGKVQLPKYVKQINSVHWQCSDPTEECITELQTLCECPVEEGQDINPAICRQTITYQMWLDSPYFNRNYKILRYAGADRSLISNSCECLWSNCSESFVVTPQKTMYLTIDSGFICVNFDSPICDDNGDVLIPDEQILAEFLVAYCIAKHWEDRQFTKEEQARAIYQEYNQKQAMLLRQARGKLMLNAVNFADVMAINGQYLKLIKIPEILFYAR
jgi:hypothetical protein